MKAALILGGIVIAAILATVGFILWLATTSNEIDEMVKAEKDQFPS